MSGRVPNLVIGAVLAGGRFSRFGSDKAEACWEGRTLLDHVVARLTPQVDSVVIVGRSHPTLPSLPDWPEPDLGPLGGLCAALHHAREEGFAAVVSVGCDMPLLPANLVRTLAGEEPAVVIGCPLIGWWPSRLAKSLEQHLLAGGSRAMRQWAERVGARQVDLGTLVNVNTPADLRSLNGSMD